MTETEKLYLWAGFATGIALSELIALMYILG